MNESIQPVNNRADSFEATIRIIGVNPYVIPPGRVLQPIFRAAGKDRGPLPVSVILDGHAFTQSLVKYAGSWRLYLNTPMRKACGKDVGDRVQVILEFDRRDRTISLHPQLERALRDHDHARKVFEALPPSRRKEINRYLHALKSPASIKMNVDRAIRFLTGSQRFIGRDRP